MKRQSITKGMMLFLMLAGIMVSVFSFARPVHAKWKLDEVAKEDELVIVKGREAVTWLDYEKGGKVTRLKSSDPDVAAIEKDKQLKYHLKITSKKEGKTIFTFRYTYKGKTKRYRFVWKVFHYRVPVKSLSIGTVDLTSKFKKSFNLSVRKSLKGKIEVRRKKGWTLDAIIHEDRDGNQKDLTKTKNLRSLKKGEYLYFVFRSDEVLEDLVIMRPEE